MIRFGIIGAGRIGKVHAKTITEHPDAEVIAVSDPFGTAAEDLAGPLAAKAYKEAEQIFADPDVDAVVIGSPTPLHVDHIIAAAKAGKAALCEKPIAMSSDEETRLREGLEGIDAKVMLGFNRRFDPSFKQMHDLVEAGEIGPVEQLTIISRDPAAPPKDYIAVSGGIFKDMTIHDFDTARYFLGPIVSVQATGQNLDPDLADTGDFDAAVIILKNAAGAVATIVNSRHCATGYDQRLEAFGPKGMLFADNVRATTVRLSKDHYSDSAGPYLDFFLERYADAYAIELSTFIEALRDGTEISPSIDDAFAALKVAEAAEKSARGGGETIIL
ncbi:MAG: inositol 2-dehydrogenase [Actinomycetaceae bacterium]|nr:inositol 2-dehydrogenase [Actinomycetaceae bacterium]